MNFSKKGYPVIPSGSVQNPTTPKAGHCFLLYMEERQYEKTGTKLSFVNLAFSFFKKILLQKKLVLYF